MTAMFRQSFRGLILAAVTLVPVATHGQSADDMRLYSDPSGEFKVKVPRSWQFNFITDNPQGGILTTFKAPDETGFLSFLVVGPLSQTKDTENILVDLGRPYFEWYRDRFLGDEDKFENLKPPSEIKKERLGDRLCLRQDYSYRRRNSVTPREASAFAFFTENSFMFVTTAGTAEGVKVARASFRTFAPGPAKPAADPKLPVLDSEKRVFGTAEMARREVAELERRVAGTPRDVSLLNDLKLAYAKMIYHYSSGDLKRTEKAEERANEFLEKSRQTGLRIAAETLRSLKVPNRVTTPDPDEGAKGNPDRLHDQSFQGLIGYQKSYEELKSQETIVLQTVRQITNMFAYNAVEWIQKTDLGTPTGRERSARLLSTALGLYSVIDRHFQQVSRGVSGAAGGTGVHGPGARTPRTDAEDPGEAFPQGQVKEADKIHLRPLIMPARSHRAPRSHGCP